MSNEAKSAVRVNGTDFASINANNLWFSSENRDGSHPARTLNIGRRSRKADIDNKRPARTAVSLRALGLAPASTLCLVAEGERGRKAIFLPASDALGVDAVNHYRWPPGE
jgi:hypothetical protein